MNGPESFTPDNQFILGRGARGAALLRRRRLQLGGHRERGRRREGAGRVDRRGAADDGPLARGHPSLRRAGTATSAGCASAWWKRPGCTTPSRIPLRDFKTGRGVRRSPLHERLAARGAAFGSKMGWERANWFATGGAKPETVYSFGSAELDAVLGRRASRRREAVAVFDQTSFSKFLLEGRDAEAVLQRLCANDVAVPPGKVVYTGMLNERGGYESDLTVTRLSRGRVLHRDRHGPVDARCRLDRAPHPRRRARPPHRRHVVPRRPGRHGPELARAARAPHRQRPVERCVSLRDDAGDRRRQRDGPCHPHDVRGRARLGAVRPRGVRRGRVRRDRRGGRRPRSRATPATTRSTRSGSRRATARGGASVTPDDTPLEAGLEFAVRLDKAAGFIGREALVAQRARGITKRLVTSPSRNATRGRGETSRSGATARSSAGSPPPPSATRSAARSPWATSGIADGVDRRFIESGRYEIEIAGARVKADAASARAVRSRQRPRPRLSRARAVSGRMNDSRNGE